MIKSKFIALLHKLHADRAPLSAQQRLSLVEELNAALIRQNFLTSAKTLDKNTPQTHPNADWYSAPLLSQLFAKGFQTIFDPMPSLDHVRMDCLLEEDLQRIDQHLAPRHKEELETLILSRNADSHDAMKVVNLNIAALQQGMGFISEQALKNYFQQINKFPRHYISHHSLKPLTELNIALIKAGHDPIESTLYKKMLGDNFSEDVTRSQTALSQWARLNAAKLEMGLPVEPELIEALEKYIHQGGVYGNLMRQSALLGYAELALSHVRKDGTSDQLKKLTTLVNQESDKSQLEDIIPLLSQIDLNLIAHEQPPYFVSGLVESMSELRSIYNRSMPGWGTRSALIRLSVAYADAFAEINCDLIRRHKPPVDLAGFEEWLTGINETVTSRLNSKLAALGRIYSAQRESGVTPPPAPDIHADDPAEYEARLMFKLKTAIEAHYHQSPPSAPYLNDDTMMAYLYSLPAKEDRNLPRDYADFFRHHAYELMQLVVIEDKIRLAQGLPPAHLDMLEKIFSLEIIQVPQNGNKSYSRIDAAQKAIAEIATDMPGKGFAIPSLQPFLTAITSKALHGDSGSRSSFYTELCMNISRLYAASIRNGTPGMPIDTFLAYQKSFEQQNVHYSHFLRPVFEAAIDKNWVCDDDLEAFMNWTAESNTPEALQLIAIQHYTDSALPLPHRMQGLTDQLQRWQKAGLPLQFDDLLSAYLKSQEPAKFMTQTKTEAARLIRDGFDLQNSNDVRLAYIGALDAGIEMTWQEYQERIDLVKKHQAAYPGSFQALFDRAKRLPTLTLSARDSEVDPDDIDMTLLSEHLIELDRIKQSMDNFSWIEQNFPGNKHFSLHNLYFQFMKTQALTAGTLKPSERFKIDIPDDDKQIIPLIAQQQEAFYLFLFNFCLQRIRDQQLHDRLVPLMRDLIISEILSDSAFREQLASTDPNTALIYFKMMYHDSVNHLPAKAGKKLADIKGLAGALDTLGNPVRQLQPQSGNTDKMVNFTLVPAGFLGLFRGRAGIVDCTFKTDTQLGVPFIWAMQEDTDIYLVRKASQLKGYVGMTWGVNPQGKTYLGYDTIQSPSLDGEELLENLFMLFDRYAKSQGGVGTALPDNMQVPFNFENRITITRMPIYQQALPVTLTPLHADNWDQFVSRYGMDNYGENTMHEGNFQILQVNEDGETMGYQAGQRAGRQLIKTASLDPEMAQEILARLNSDQIPPFVWKYKEWGLYEKTLVDTTASGIDGLLDGYRQIGANSKWSLAYHGENVEGQGDIIEHLLIHLPHGGFYDQLRHQLENLRTLVPAEADSTQRMRRDLMALGLLQGILEQLAE